MRINLTGVTGMVGATSPQPKRWFAAKRWCLHRLHSGNAVRAEAAERCASFVALRDPPREERVIGTCRVSWSCDACSPMCQGSCRMTLVA